jgi:hypothetical protein
MYLKTLITKTVQHTIEHLSASFDIISTAQEDNPVPSGIRQHLHNFLSLSVNAQLPWEDGVVFIALALMMDAYPPGMHSMSYFSSISAKFPHCGSGRHTCDLRLTHIEFDPQVVFRQLYADHYTTTLKVTGLGEAQIRNHEIESAFIHYTNLLYPLRRTVTLRKKMLRSGQK